MVFLYGGAHLVLLCIPLPSESHRPVQTSARREIVHIFRVYFPPAQRRVRLSPIESFVLNAATAADEQQRPRKINSCFYKTPESHRPVQTSARREIVHIFRVYPPAQRRVRLSPIESFVLNAATAADEQPCRVVRAFDPTFAATHVDSAFVDGMSAITPLSCARYAERSQTAAATISLRCR